MNYNFLSSNNNNYWNYALPHYEIIKVNGEEGAKAFRMAPNSSCFLADTTNPNLIWIAQTDGAGYGTVTPLDVTLHQTQPPVDVNSFDARIKELENKYEQLLNTRTGKQQRKQGQQPDTTDSAG